MKRIPFSIPVSGVIIINGESISISINPAEMKITTESEPLSQGKIVVRPGKSLCEIILEAAREIVKRQGYNRFGAPDIYAVASEKYQGLNKDSLTSRIISSTPNHPSFKHHQSQRDYFRRIGPGMFALEDKYIEKEDADMINTLRRGGKTLFDTPNMKGD